MDETSGEKGRIESNLKDFWSTKGGCIVAIEWTADLATGVDEIDNQHKELFQRINNLLEACNHGKGKEEVKKVISFLEDYVITTFLRGREVYGQV